MYNVIISDDISDDISVEAEREECLHLKAETVLRAGKLALSSGMGAYRVKQVMGRIANALGISNHAHVSLMEISSTCHDGTLFNTETDTIPSTGVDTNKIHQIGLLTYGLKRKEYAHTTECINGHLARIETMPKLYPKFATGLFAGLACFAFTFLIGGDITEMIGAFFGATLGGWLRTILLSRAYNQFVSAVCGVLVAGIVYFGYIFIAVELGLANTHQFSGYVGALLFVIPGFPLVTGGLDLAKLDFSSGIARLTYALAIILCATTAGWLFTTIFSIAPEDLVSPYSDWGQGYILARFIASFLGVAGFALMFNSKKRTALVAAIIGAFANALRLSLVDFGTIPFVAATLAAIFVGLLASLVCKYFDYTRITITVPAIVIMVPGTWLFKSFSELGSDHLDIAAHYGVKAFLVIFALPVGLAVARFLTDPKWRHDS